MDPTLLLRILQSAKAHDPSLAPAIDGIIDKCLDGDPMRALGLSKAQLTCARNRAYRETASALSDGTQLSGHATASLLIEAIAQHRRSGAWQLFLLTGETDPAMPPLDMRLHNCALAENLRGRPVTTPQNMARLL